MYTILCTYQCIPSLPPPAQVIASGNSMPENLSTIPDQPAYMILYNSPHCVPVVIMTVQY